jgi:hypothetical protein
MPLTNEQRKSKIDLIRQGDPINIVKIPYRDKTAYEVKVYQIPWDALIYNQFNDRIGLALKTKLNPLGAEGLTHDYDEILHELIEKELWESAVPENKITKQSMEVGEQIEPGIITADGVIVDGNRRALIAKLAGKKFFLTGVLDDLYEGNEEILRDLETQLQFSVESKVDYNPLEKYFKVKTHVEKFNKSYEKLAKLMGPKYKPSKLIDMHEIANLMDEYLTFLEAPRCYDLLLISGTKNSKENAFLTLHNKLKQMESGSFTTDDYDYSELKDDYKQVMFNFIRTEAVSSPQDYPKYLSNKKGTGFFRGEKIKDELISKVDDIMSEATMDLPGIKELRLDSENSTLDNISLVKKREEILRAQTKERMQDLMKEMIAKKLHENRKLRPLERIQIAHQELSSINDEDLDSLFESDERTLITDQINQIEDKINQIKRSLRS